MRAKAPRIVIVPGLRDHVEGHWQTLLERRLPDAVSVPRLGLGVDLAGWVAALELAVQGAAAPVFLVAHSAGVMIAVQWARWHRGRVRGALLATPPDLSVPLPAPYPALAALAANGWLDVPRDPLPFPAIVAASSNDPLASLSHVESLARGWRARIAHVGDVGHLNPASGYGEWPAAMQLLRELGAPVDGWAAAG